MEDIYCPGFTWIELLHPNANKRDALTFLKERLNCDQVISFGDNYNDIEMFDISDKCYAGEIQRSGWICSAGR